MRKLASIKEVSEIHPIEGRDRIVLAIIDGWSVIVKKDEFVPGDKCVYIEIDSVLPEKPEFEFLKDKGYRIKTMKMAGVISQGICFPLDILPDRKKEYQLEEDVTDIIGVKQYERTMDKEPEPKAATKDKYPRWLMRMKWFRKLVLPKKESRAFPSFIAKTDETRVQNIPYILNSSDDWTATEKIDGQSGTFAMVRRKSKIPFMKNKYEYIVCSRNLRLFNKDNSSYWKVSDRYNIEAVLKAMLKDTGHEWIAIQGECVAPNVQGNKYNVTEPDLYVFNVITPVGRLSSIAAVAVADHYGLKFVPIVAAEMTLPRTVDECLAFAHGKSAIGDTLREGIVFRSMDGKQSFKAVDPLFLLKYDE